MQFFKSKLVDVLVVLIVVEGVFCVWLTFRNNDLSSSYEELSGEYDALLNLYDELTIAFEDLHNGYLALQNTSVWEFDVTVKEVMILIETKPNLVVVDVRDSQEFASGHIVGAVNLPVTDSELLLNNLNPADEILVYCQSGGRSETAQQLLNANGYDNVYNMLGGIVAWIDAGYPTT